MARLTRNLELVETEALMLALKRLSSGDGGYQLHRWKRALYHALAMAKCVDTPAQLEAIRRALNLP